MRYKCIVAYDGSEFHGFQTQFALRTVQEEIEKVLLIILKDKTFIHACSRTDTKVHAISAVFHFDSVVILEPWQMKNAINTRLPKDIYIKKVEIVDETFHSRYNAIKKEYHYKVSLKEFDVFKRNYYYQPFKLDFNIDKMIDASSVFVGTHDFKSFTKNKKTPNTIRTIYSIDFELLNDVLVIKFCGSGFLHNMVRILVAMLFEVGYGKYSKNDLKTILEQKNRQYAPKLAPANGLYLYRVYYNDN